MKAIYVAMMAAAGLAISSQAFADAGKDLATKKGCLACHDEAAKKIGPAYKEVAAKYKAADAGKLADSILKGTGPAGKGWMKEGKASLAVMPANTTVSPEEAKTLATWVLSHK
jgi:cytochrome c